MIRLPRLRSRLVALPLRQRLPITFAAVALLTMLVLGAILVLLLGDYYGDAEVAYLQAGAARASSDLAAIDWPTVEKEAAAVAKGTTAQSEAAALLDAQRQAQGMALSTQARLKIYATDGTLLVDSGSPNTIDASGILRDRGSSGAGRAGQGPSDTGTADQTAADQTNAPRDDGPSSGRGLPSPIGSGLFGTGSEEGARSSRSIETGITSAGKTVAVMRLSEGPAYGSAVLRTTLVGWLVAGFGAVVLAAIVGWLTSRHMTRPLLAITKTSRKMASGDLTVRAPVERSDEIGSLARSFNDMADTVQTTVSALQRFVADAAHELGTPLTALEADLQLAQTQTDDAGRDRLLARALRQADRLDQLSRNLLRLSRLDTKADAEAFSPLDLVALLREMGDSYASRAEQADIDFRLELPAQDLTVRAQPDRLRTAIENLVDNALKFTPAGGTVTVGARKNPSPTGDRALAWVDDTGIGIPAEDREALFSRFHRGRNAAAIPGSGLGLAIVKTTMDIHGGTVTMEGKAQGSRFELGLPLA